MMRKHWADLDLDADLDTVSYLADLDILSHLSVEVRPAERPSRWAWHIVDRRDGSEFERELEYESSIDAQRAGLARLAELRALVPLARIVAARSYRLSA